MSASGEPTRAGVLRTRLLFGSSLVAASVGVVLVDWKWLPVWGTGLVLAGLALAAQAELYGMIRRAGLPVASGFGLGCGAYFLATRFLPVLFDGKAVAAAYDGGAHLAVVTVAILVRGVLRRRTESAPVESATTLLGVVVVPFLLGYLIEIRVFSPDPWLTVFCAGLAKACDSFAYFGGIALGRARLIPEISPKKTWAGAVSGLLGTAVLAAALGATGNAGGLGPAEALGAGLLVAVAAQFADLAESLLKRGCGVKDSGAAIPVLGGAFDLVDSLLFAAPALRVYAAALGRLRTA
ncbi:MAG TPA: phosphatidate cytidylyltransferase [Planctomycetota bacterium]|nr:phosphatidate cytidylyltransferase [Planctomycetota bacterium]